MNTGGASDGPPTKWTTHASIAARPRTPPPGPTTIPGGAGTSASTFSDCRLHVVQALFGDCFLLEFTVGGHRKFWLVDGGPGDNNMPFNSKDHNSGSMFSCLFETLNGLEVEKLDTIVVTHRDYDHLHGIVLLLASLVPSREEDLDIMADVGVDLWSAHDFKPAKRRTGGDGRVKDPAGAGGTPVGGGGTPPPSGGGGTPVGGGGTSPPSSGGGSPVIDHGSSSSSSSSSTMIARSGGLLRWQRGFDSWNATTRTFPIDRIWYNDRNIRLKWLKLQDAAAEEEGMLRRNDRNKKNAEKRAKEEAKEKGKKGVKSLRLDLVPNLGWMEKLLLGFYRTFLQSAGQTVLPLEVPGTTARFALNSEWEHNVVHTGNPLPAITNGLFDLRLVGPHQDVLKAAKYVGGNNNIRWERLNRSFHSDTYFQYFSSLDDLLEKFWQQETINESVEKRDGENVCSIMFELGPPGSSAGTNQPGRMLFTGDGAGWDIERTYQYANASARKIPLLPADDVTLRGPRQAPRFQLIKILHHGSQRNNTLVSDATSYDDAILPFFTSYNANVYCISSHPLIGPAPNPDTSVLRAIVLAHRDLNLPPPIIFMTNGCSPVGLWALSHNLPEPYWGIAYFLKPEQNFGTIDFSRGIPQDGNDHWNRMRALDAQCVRYFGNYVEGFTDTFGDDDSELAKAASNLRDKELQLQLGKKKTVDEFKKAMARLDAAVGLPSSQPTARSRGNPLAKVFDLASGKRKSDAVTRAATSLLKQTARRNWPAWMEMGYASARPAPIAEQHDIPAGTGVPTSGGADAEADDPDEDDPSMFASPAGPGPVGPPVVGPPVVGPPVVGPPVVGPPVVGPPVVGPPVGPRVGDGGDGKKRKLSTIVASLNDGEINSTRKQPRRSKASITSADANDADAQEQDASQNGPSLRLLATSRSSSLKRTLPRASPATIPTAPLSKHVDFHDLMLSGSFEQILTGDTDLDSVPALNDPANNLGRATQGMPCRWVDLNAFIRYITQPNLGLTLDETYISYLNRLFTTRNGEDPIVLLGTFLSMIFTPNFASRFLCQLPLNGNGKFVHLLPQGQDTNSAILNLSVVNFRAAIPVASTSSLVVAAIWFQIQQPPVELWKPPLTPGDALVWTLPYQTRHWKAGWITLMHTTPLTIKMVAPFFENRAITCRFRGQLDVGRVQGTTSLHVLGKMVACGAEPAAYDLRLIDKTAPAPTLVSFSPFDILNTFAPISLASSSLFDSVFGSTLSQMTIPGLDAISKLASQAMRLKDGGIILRQVKQDTRAVDVQDIYGTIDLAEKLDQMFSAISKAMGLTSTISIPGDLSLTVTLKNITHIGSNDVSFAFEYPIPGLGDVAVEIAPGTNGLTQFDFWLICDDGVTFGSLLDHALSAVIGFTSDADAFRAARVFVGLLDPFKLPYLRLTFAETDSKSKNIELISYGLMLEVDPIVLGPIVLDSASLALMKINGVRQEVNAYGNAIIDFGAGVDAICSFTVDHQAEDIAGLIESSQDNFINPFKSAVQLNISFPDKRPSILTILDAVIPASLGDLPIFNAIPGALAWVFDAVTFENVSLGVVSEGDDTGWRLATFYFKVNLEMLDGSFDFLGEHFAFGTPTFSMLVLNPTDHDTRSINAQVLGTMFVAGCVCDLTLTMADKNSDTDSAGNAVPASYTSLAVGMNVNQGDLLFVKAFEHFLKDVIGNDASNALDSIVGPFIPDKLTEQLRSIGLDCLLLRIVDKSDGTNDSKYSIQHFEAMVHSTLTQWKPWDALGNFSLDQIYFRVIYDTGEVVGPSHKVTPAKAVACDFGCVAHFGANHSLNANISYQTVTADSKSTTWILTLTETDDDDLFTLKLGDLIAGAASEIGFNLPQDIHSQLDSLLTLAPKTLQITYLETAKSKGISFSQKGGNTTIMGCQLTEIDIICEKPSTSGWSWTIALAVKDAVNPLGRICPLFSVVEIKNANVAFWNGIISSSLPHSDGLGTSPTGSNFMLAGTLVLHNNPFLEIIKGFMLGSPEIDFCITKDTFRIDKQIDNSGFMFVPFLKIFELYAFHISADQSGFSVGGTARLIATWLSKDIDGTDDPRPHCQFEAIIHDDGGIGVDIKVDALKEPFGIPGLKVEKLHVAVAVMAEGGELEALTIQGTFELGGQDQVAKDADVRAVIDLNYSSTQPDKDHIFLDIEHLSIFTVARALAGTHFPTNSALSKIGDLVLLKELQLALEPKAGKFSFNANLILFGLHGFVVAEVQPDPTSNPGVTIGAHLDVINVLSIISIQSHSDPKAGPYMYINTRLGDQSTQTDLLHIDSSQDAERAHSPFIVSGKLQFLTITWDVFGRVSTSKGVELIVGNVEAIHVPGLDLKTTESTKIEFDPDGFKLTDEWRLAVKVSVPNLSWLPFGSIDIPGFDVDIVVSCLIKTPDGDWQHDGMTFVVEVEAEVPIVGHIPKTSITLPITISSLSDIPGVIEKFFEDKVLEYLKKFIDPFEKAFEATKDFVEKQAKILAEDLNVAEQAVVSTILSGYHDVEQGLNIAASVVADTFNYGVNELCSAMSNVGYTAATIAAVVGDVLDASAQDVASGLISAGISVEHAFESAFGEGMGAVGKEFGLIGNTIASGIDESVSTVENFFVGDVGGFVQDLGNDFKDVGEDIGHGVEGAVNAVGDFFSSLF